uniref:Uncharacterized protein n=1 Tax=Rhizophora mucronata TaxID=61149 RepID=A0A2P2IVW2_RHIMU
MKYINSYCFCNSASWNCVLYELHY